MSNNAAHTPKRLDLQGLRAVAVLVVVLYHAGVPIPGGFVGVDVFFVLSGFLIIGLLVNELTTRGRIDFGQFWAKRARRLVPASALVLVATLAVGSTVLSYFDRKALATDAMWSALFSANWNYAFAGDDYMNADGTPSAFRHFWSLAVEEQFYLLAPVLLAVIGWVAFRKGRPNPRFLAGAFLTLVAIVSLSYCVWLSFTNPASAYYDTGARAWQLAAGGLLAIAMTGRTLTARTSTVLGGAGVVLLTVSLFGLSESGALGLTYPSVLALAPTVATLALIAAGSGTSLLGRFLSLRPVTYVGDISYSLYLWHWPFLALGWHITGSDSLTTGLALVAASVAASVVTFHGVENPIRNSNGLRVMTRPIVSVAMAASMVFVTVQISTQIRSSELDTTRHATLDQIGSKPAAPNKPVFDDSVTDVKPALATAPKDEKDMRTAGCQIAYPDPNVSDVKACTFGNKTSTNRVFIIGDSISSAVFPAVEKAARGEWAITVLAKSACTIADINRYRPEHPDEFWTECATWREDVIDVVLDERPDLVIIGASENSLTKMVGTDGTASARNVADATRGMASSLRRFQKAGIKTALVQSSVIAPFKVPECLSKRLSVKKCSWSSAGLRTTDEVAKVLPNVAYIPTMNAYCKDGECVPVADRRVVFRDTLHFTKTFSKSLAPRFAPVLEGALARDSST
ncbi:acyltransferase family protein [Aeromicrobium sp. 179-A 4D2 NHS]|uniref:acyltransferase family protein n=1 Tax=Aeromicrobium sp. 179-A 4D2 NHS TaxID=3142375 RepID=UPI0039A31E85